MTQNALVIPDVARQIGLPGYVELRGEVYMSHADFERFNEQAGGGRETDGGQSAQPGGGNAAPAGLPGSQTARPEKCLYSTYRTPAITGVDLMESHGKSLQILQDNGIACVRHTVCGTPEQVLEAIHAIGESRGRSAL